MFSNQEIFKTDSGEQEASSSDQIDFIESKSKLSLRINRNRRIDDFILSKTISDFALIIQEVAKEENPNAYVKMEVQPFENGSFAIVFSAICSSDEPRETTLYEDMGLAEIILLGVTNVFDISRFLKGEKPKKTTYENNGTITIVNHYNIPMNIPASSFRTYEKAEVQKKVANIALYAKEYDNEQEFILADEDGEMLYSDDDVDGMLELSSAVSEAFYKTYQKKETLFIKKPDILGFSAWEFRIGDLEEGKNIVAKIDDEKFMEYTSRGISISKGSFIEAILETRYELDKTGIEIKGREKYTIISVFGGIQKDNK